MSSFDNKKELKFIITLGTGSFGSSANNTITLEGYRAVVDIDKAGGMMMGTLRAQIFGISQGDINSITTLQWKPKSFIHNTVQVFAIDGAQETLIFTGNIINAWGNYQAMPDVFLMIQAQAAYFAQIKVAQPKSYKGSIDAVKIMSQLADDMHLIFENNGVTAQLSDQYLPNTALEQAKAVQQAAGFWMFIDNGVLAITPKNAGRLKPIPLISAQTGMVGYPTFDGVGVNFQTLFNPSVIFGGSIQIVTDVLQARGIWIATSIALRLESEKPGGAWFMTIRGTKSGLAVTHA